MKELVEQKIGYAQVTLTSNWDILIKNVLSGPGILFLDGFEQALILDTRSYPTRGISEPETEKIIREAKDGFVETVLFNTNMIRRRIRSPKLTFEITSIGKESKTDIVIAFMNGLAEEDLLLQIRKKLSGIDADSLTMGMKSLEELLLHKRWYHPLPAFFSTERPDVACSYLMEGYVLLMVDTTPAALILPCSLFQFTQSPEDYYKSTVVGTYIRIIRFICLFLHLSGFLIGLVLIGLPIFTTPVFAGKSYFWPLIPFNFSALKTLLIRYPTFMAQPNHIWHHTSKKKN